jgi:hypothetical protein
MRFKPTQQLLLRCEKHEATLRTAWTTDLKGAHPAGPKQLDTSSWYCPEGNNDLANCTEQWVVVVQEEATT